MNSLPRVRRFFGIIIAVTFLCLIINLPSQVTIFGHSFSRPNFAFTISSFSFHPNLRLRYGLDLAGGASLTFLIDTSSVSLDNLPSALESLKTNIERRVNLFGLTESSVQLTNEKQQYRLVVELAGLTDINQAIDLIGQTAQLSFQGIKVLPPEATATATLADYLIDTGLNGSHLSRAQAVLSPNTSQPEVSLEFNPEGTKLFAQATKKYFHQKIAILLDDAIITAPVVQAEIPDGKAVINGNFDIKSAKALAAQLNAGALPLPLKIISQTQIGATLGRDSIDKGIFAGLVGLILVSLFMIGNYGYLGLIADLGLFIYALITLTLYRLIPVTLTFPGIVGFILSVGMAVDSNILIFERMKEELRRGQPWNLAMEMGFGRAWDSIKDANTCTIITALILFNPLGWHFLHTSGMVRGFALTLILGITVSIFTGVVVTRNLLRILAKHKI